MQAPFWALIQTFPQSAGPHLLITLIITMVLGDTISPSRMRNTICNCQHNTDDHSLIRCGCLNDRPSSHPMHINDDAFHHTWCNICRIYCYKDAMCPNDLPDTQMVLFPSHLSAYTFSHVALDSVPVFHLYAQIHANFDAIEWRCDPRTSIQHPQQNHIDIYYPYQMLRTANWSFYFLLFYYTTFALANGFRQYVFIYFL